MKISPYFCVLNNKTMFEYDLDVLIGLREKSRPAQDTNPIENDYWVLLLKKGHEQPESMNLNEIFELGVYVERLFQTSSDTIAVTHVLPYRRRLNGIFRKLSK